MTKIALPPKRQAEVGSPVKADPKIKEKDILEIINRGGSPVLPVIENTEVLKNFNILIYESDLKIIGELCDKRPKKPGKVIRFSKKDWILEAVLEKIERERKRYDI